MPAFNSPIPRAGYANYHESSPLRDKRDPDATGKLWLKVNALKDQVQQSNNAMSQMNRVMQNLGRRILGMAPNNSVQTQTFLVVSDGGDYYNCNTWDGTTAGTAFIKVAKNQDLRCTLPTATPAGGAWPQKTIRGITYTYTYTPTAGSTADGVNIIEYVRSVSGSDSSSETDNVTPCLNVGDIISAFPTSFTAPATLVGITWQALADGRAWAAQKPPTS